MKQAPIGPLDARTDTTPARTDRAIGDRRRRLLDKDSCAEYLTVSVDTIERLIHTGALPVVRLPVERDSNGRGKAGVSRRILVDVADLDRLIDH